MALHTSNRCERAIFSFSHLYSKQIWSNPFTKKKTYFEESDNGCVCFSIPKRTTHPVMSCLTWGLGIEVWWDQLMNDKEGWGVLISVLALFWVRTAIPMALWLGWSRRWRKWPWCPSHTERWTTKRQINKPTNQQTKEPRNQGTDLPRSRQSMNQWTKKWIN